MNGHLCCILGECCPPAQRAEALRQQMIKDGLFDMHREPADISRHAMR